LTFAEADLPRRHADGPTTYVLDTNVLLYDPQALFAFKEHDVVIPLTVIEEIDRFKKDLNEVGRNARAVSRRLDDLRAVGALRDGIALDNGGRLRVEYVTHDPQMPIGWGPDTNDNRILGCVIRVTQAMAGKRVALVTRDTNMRLKCDALGLIGEDYQNAHIEVDEAYTGFVDRVVDAEIVDAVHQGPLPESAVPGLLPNQFAVLSAVEQPGRTAMVRHRQSRGTIEHVGRHREGVWGIFHKNKEQLFALDLLMDEEVKLVTITGMAGTGKTLLALAAGLKQVADDGRYRKLLVSRPIFPLGRDIGFLPGDVEQKLNPWMKPIFDNLELIISGRHDNRRGREPEYQSLLDQKIIEVEPLTYIRGRSIPGQFLIVDEAQNLTPHEVKTVLTRAGEGAKVVLTGDPNQIDHPYVDALSNGLTYTVERFKETSIAGHVTLRKGERSVLAELAARLL
jgi:PhoH-like ATPase